MPFVRTQPAAPAPAAGAAHLTESARVALAARGYTPGPAMPGGHVHPVTVSALFAFQADHGLATTGQVDPHTAAVLGVGHRAPARAAAMVVDPGTSVPTAPAGSQRAAQGGSGAFPTGGGGGGGSADGPDQQQGAAQAVAGGTMNLSIGSKGPVVAALQQLLQGMGYDIGHTGVDSIFGQHTADAVTHFQTDHGLTADGVVGPQTAAVLGLDLSTGAVSTPAGSTAPQVPLFPKGPSAGTLAVGGGLIALGGLGWYWWKHR